MFSDQANNFGTLISGVSTFILAILAIATYWRWHKEKREEKLSDVAESALNHLDTFKDQIDEWAKFANTWFIYNRQSPENMQNLDQLSSDERKKLADQFTKDRFEVHNNLKVMEHYIKQRMTHYENEFYKISNLTILDPDPDSKFKHKLHSECYQKVIQQLIKKYQKAIP